MIQAKHSFDLSNPKAAFLTRVLLILCLFVSDDSRSEPVNGGESGRRVLLIFGEARDLPGNVLMEQAVRNEVLANSTNSIEFFTESLDTSHLPGAQQYGLFGKYIREKYAGQDINLVVMFVARDLPLVREMETALATNIPSLVVVQNDGDLPNFFSGRPLTGIVQRFDISGTIQFIFRLQPETRRVVVMGGVSAADQATLRRIAEMARSMEGVKFEFWTNRPVESLCQAAGTLTPGTVILLGTVQRDAAGQPFYTSRVAQMLAPSASVPVYVLGEGMVGSGAVGGSVVDAEGLGTAAGMMALRILGGVPESQIPVEWRTNGVAMVDWRALQRWDIKQSRLPVGCIVRYRPRSLWKEHEPLILLFSAGFVGQAVTILALLVQRRQQRRAEAQIERQRTELAHVSRVSTMGQLASALTHELNQPLGAILRNAEAAEIFLQTDPPNLEEIRAILADIRRDDKRAGDVIDRMRALYKRRGLALSQLDMSELVEETILLTRADAAARKVRLTAQIASPLPPVRADRVHLQQVLLNLILNGMDAMMTVPKSRRALTVRVAETSNGNVLVSVSDRGTGVEPKNAARIFEPFFTTKPNGMGMGLAISQTIIKAHGGEIWVDAKPGAGATFAFILPPEGSPKVREGDLPADAGNPN